MLSFSPSGQRAVELGGVDTQEGGQGDGNVQKLNQPQVPGLSLGQPSPPAHEVVVVLGQSGVTGQQAVLVCLVGVLRPRVNIEFHGCTSLQRFPQ